MSGPRRTLAHRLSGVPPTVLGRPVPSELRSWRAVLMPTPTFVRNLCRWIEDQPTPETTEPNEDAEDRMKMVNAAIDVLDYLVDPALVTKLRLALRQVGVTAFDATGTRFDPTRHRGTGWETTADTGSEGMVARTEREGYEDGSGVVRPAEVLVYRGAGEPD